MFSTGKMKKKVEELKKSGLIRKNQKILIENFLKKTMSHYTLKV